MVVLSTYMFFPKAGFGQAPDLGNAAGFAVFSAVGAISNVGGATHIFGDAGTNVGAFTGITPWMVTGSIHVADATSALAASAVANAYSQMFSQTCGKVAGPLLGNGQILTPNVYCIGSAASLTGTLTLDAKGDPNAVFVIKINGAFSIAAQADITLINSASVNNVYWQIGGRTDLATGANFQGTILVDGAIALGNFATFQGRLLSRSGAVTFYNNTIVIAGSPSARPLPVELVSFTAQALNGTGELRWETASEKDNAYFGVESSADGRSFIPLGTVVGQGTSAQRHSYTWSDGRLARYASPVVYYRLREVATNNTVTYSPVQLVPAVPCATSAPVQVQAYPNPFQGPVSLALESAQAQVGTLRLSDAQGHLLVQRALTLPAGRSTLALPETAALRPGVYFLQLQTGAQRQRLTLVRQ